MLTYLNRLTAERDSLTQAATDITERAAREERDVTDTERASLTSMSTRCGEIDAQLTEYNAQAESQRAYARLRSQLATVDDEQPPAVQQRNGQGAALETRGWGDLFAESDAFRSYPGMGSSQRVEVPGVLEQRAAIAVGTFPAGALPPFTYTPATFTYDSPLLDVVGKTTTSSNAVQWVQWTPNPQAAASIVAEGEVKPEAAMTPNVVSDTLDTYAHWKGITRQALEDIPQIRSIVENRLRQGVVVALEGAVTAALTGATMPTVPGSEAAGDTMLSLIRRGQAAVQAAGYGNANAVLLNPVDWADIDVAIMGGTLGGPTSNGSLWGLRPVAVPALPPGTAYVGNFAVAVQLFTRATAEVFMTDSHADYFVRNIILLLAEQRALATVPDPSAAAKLVLAA